jgi:hypothetical protein
MAQRPLDHKEEEYWEQLIREAPVAAIEKIEDTAKHLVSLTSLLQGIYFAAVSFSDIRSQMRGLQKVLLLLPLVCWLPSLYYAMRVLRPRRRVIGAEPQQVREDYIVIRDQKDRDLGAAFAWLAGSLALLVLIISWYLFAVPLPPASVR